MRAGGLTTGLKFVGVGQATTIVHWDVGRCGMGVLS